ncbi:Cystathionine beta-lyase (CBL) (Beta-cystathionase) (Cysteine lyase) (Cysteine-S-conjugate beta-lyase) [Durusdinium trenchii]|uniref:cystathionine gamma-lyase n=1 Tax=Durusdinium trenchii TaxID=1381693 RepID=A0ABP0M570_9DINO
MKFGTKAIHAGLEPDPTTGAIMTPIYQTSTYVQASPGDHKGYEYSRTQNPTRHALEKNFAALENAKHGLAFASGLAATDALMKTLKPGDEVISTNDLYGGTYRLFTKVFEGYGLKFHFVDMTDLSNVSSLINEKTKVVWAETPTNPMMSIIDIRGLADLLKGKDILLAVDNTFSSPYLQNPIDHGADVVMHSVTKYLAGHSDVVMGALMLNDDQLQERLAFLQNASGAVPGPQDSFLVLRGIKTLHLRMQRHSENGREVAQYLRGHEKVDKVYWPGFEDHPNFEIAKKQMRDFGGMISFTMKDDSVDYAVKILERFKLFSLAESLGGVESLSGHPASMTHASIPREERLKSGLKDSLIRLSVGVEDIEDLIADLKQAIG